MIRRAALFLSLLLAVMPLAANAADAGKADGKLTVSGKPHKLTNAYAIEMMTDAREKYYRVFLTDVALSDKQIGGFPDVLVKEINEGKIHAIGITIGLDKPGKLDRADIYNDQSFPSITEPNKLDLKSLDGKTIAGRLYLDKPHQDLDGETYAYDVKFSAPIRPETDFLQ